MSVGSLTIQDCHNLKVLLTRTPITGTTEAKLLAVLDLKLEQHIQFLQLSDQDILGEQAEPA